MEPSVRGAAGAFPGRRLKEVPGPPPRAGGWGPQKGHVPKATRLTQVVKQKASRSGGPVSPTLIQPHPHFTATPPFPHLPPHPHFLPYPSMTSALSTAASLSYHSCPDVPGPRSLRQVHRQATVGPTPASRSMSLWCLLPTALPPSTPLPSGHSLAWRRAGFWARPLRRLRSLLASFPHLSNKSGM